MKRILILIIVMIGVGLWIGCGDDNSTTNPPGTTSFKPTINLTPGATYNFTNDSLTFNLTYTDTIRTRMIATTADVIQPLTNIGGQDCYPIITTTAGIQDTIYIRYDASAGKLYQYGINNIIDSTQPRSWDLLGDFTIARGTSWTIGTAKYRYNIFELSGPLTAKVADSLVFQSTGNPSVNVNAYRIELMADMKDPSNLVTAKIYLDYYIGFNNSTITGNPPGIVRLKVRPFLINFGPSKYPYPGFDRIISGWTIP